MLPFEKQPESEENNSLGAKTSATLFRLLSHELRSPLANIITTSTFYLEEMSKLSENRKSSLVQNIQTDATQLLAQIENIISLSHLTQSSIQMSITEFDAVIAKAVRRTRLKYPLRTITINSSFDTLAFPMEAVLMEHAIMLLLKLMHEQLPDSISIQCLGQQQENHVVLTLQAFRTTMIFSEDSPFQNSSDLEICQLIIQAHQGILHATSATDALTYEIELPLKETL